MGVRRAILHEACLLTFVLYFSLLHMNGPSISSCSPSSPPRCGGVKCAKGLVRFHDGYNGLLK